MLNFLCKGINGRYGVPRIPVRRSDMLLYGIFILLLCVSQVWGDCDTPCPTGCTCSRPTSKKECMVNCTNAGLTGVPSENQMPNSPKYIKFLYLDENNISSLASDAFTFMTNLEEIYLQGNNLNSSSIASDAFHLNHLKKLDLSNNPLTIIGGDLFDDSKKIENLNLSRTQLTSLNDNAFDTIQELKELDLSWNNLQFISEDMFKKVTYLEVLNLSGNAFDNVASIDIDFDDLNDLITLDISNNKFTEFPANRLSLLTNLQQLNIANNPFECSCTLMSLRTELVTLESNGLTLVDRNNINCSRSSKSVNIMDQSSDGFWCPDKLGSCYYDSEDKMKYNVLFTYATSVSDNQTCFEECFDNNSTYGIYENQLCMCGYKHTDTTNDCWCSLKNYADGQNMACQDSSNTNIVYVGGVYPITAGLTMQAFDRLTAGIRHDFRAQVNLATIVQYTWSFGDSSELITRTTTLLYYSISHTYSIPGTYTLTVTACTAQSACTSIAIPVEVRPTVTSDDLEITCPTSTLALSTTVTVTGKIKSGYNAEYKWSKLPTDNVTATTEGQCLTSWQFFHGRCLQKLASSSNYAAATGTCNGGQLLTIHYPEEITDLLSTFSSLSTIYLGAKKNGNGYKWTNGNQAYFMAIDITDSSVGDCVVIDRTTGGLKGKACTSSHSIICQQTPDTECPYGGYYYSSNNNCYKLYTTSLNWTNAKSACEALTNQSELAVVDSQSLGTFIENNVFQSTTTPAWVGLTDRDAEKYLMWTNNQSVVNYNPIGTAQETDCITVDSSGSWSHFSCQELKYYICQYSLRETMKIPTYVAGVGRLAASGVSYNLTTIGTTSLPTSTITIIWLFPGLTITRSGELQKWNFRNEALSQSSTISFQVYSPVCPSGTTRLHPGCNGNGGRYASCSSTVSSCPAVPYCNEGSDVCYHSNTCIPVSDPCDCTESYCSTPFTGSRPTYRLVGQTVVSLSSGQNGYFSVVDTNGIEVNEGDILGFQASTSSDLIKCDHTDINMLQNALQVISSSWHSNGDIIDTTSASWRNNTACYFQAVYSIPEEVNLPPSLQYSTVAGTYSYEISLPDNNINKICTITVEEDVGEGDLVWLSPPIQSSSGGTETFNVESDTETYILVTAKRGTNLEAEWEIEGNTYDSSFSSSCPSSVQTEIGTLSDSSNYWITEPFTYIKYNFTYNSGSTTQVKVKVKNSIGSNNKTVHAQVFLPLSVEFNLTDISHGYLVEINKVISFTTTVTSGNPTAYSYYINGSSEHNATTVAAFTHTFTSKDVYEVNVLISDGFSSTSASVTVYSRYAANVQTLTLVGIPSTVTKNSAVQFQATATVNANSYITVQWEFETGSVSTSQEASSTSLQLSKSHTHTINGTYTFRLTITDEFSNTATVSQTIRVVEEMPSVTVSATPVMIQTGSNIDFEATVPNLSSADYGTLEYGFDFNDTNIETSSSKRKIHTFSTAGTYYVTVSVSNGAQTVEATVTVKVFDEITGLSIVSNRIVEVNTSVSLSASVTTGNSLTYSFEVPALSLSSGNITTNGFTVTLDQTGHFNITLKAWNELFMSDVYKEIYIVDRDTLEIMGFTHDRYKATNSPLSVVVDVLYYDYSDLVLTWGFGTHVIKGSTFSPSYTFTSAGTFNITVTIQSSSTGKHIAGYSTVEIQDTVTGVSVSNNGPVGLSSTGSVSVVITATVTAGTNLKYTWSYGSTVVTSTANTLTLTRSSEEVVTVSVMVWNDVSHENGTTTYKVQQVIEGLQITCLNCTDNNNMNYLQSTKTASFVASLTFGTNVTYNWSFGDGSSGVGISQTHAYSAAGTYTITLSGENDVGTVPVTFTIYVQESITSVSLTLSNSQIFIGTSATVTATAVDGTDIAYAFQDCGICDQTHQTSNIYTTGIYNESGRYIVAVKASNLINSVAGSTTLTVLDYVTSVSVLSNLTNEKYAAVGAPYTFSAQPNTNLDVYYSWSVKQASATIFTLPVYSSQNFTYTFLSPLAYEVLINVFNVLGSSYQAVVQVDAQQEISGVQVVMDKNSPIATAEAVQVTAVVAVGTSLSYKWFHKNSTGLYELSYTTKTFSHTFNNRGDHTFILEVQNNLGNDTANKTITVMEAVTGVGVSSLINESYPYIAVNTTVQFSAVVSTGESYTTTWTLTGISPAVTSSGSDFSYEFGTSGTYKITVSVQNTVSSEQYELTFYVQGSISLLSLVPDSSLARTGQSVTFTANYNSGADNLIFEWTIEGTLTNVTSNTLTHVFTTAGTITAYITVYNHISKMSTQIDITVEVPVSGLLITGCNTTGVIDTAVSATASATLGTDVTYNYKLETGSTTSKSGTGATLSHTYSITGVYDLYVNASNQVSLESIYCIFTIIGPISGLRIDTSNSNFFVNYQLEFQVSGNNLIGVTYNWYFLPINVNDTTSDSVLQKTFTTASTYTYTLIVSNSISSKTVTGTFVIEPLHCTTMTLTKGGQSEKIRKKSLTSTFEVMVNKHGCTAYTLSYAWKVYNSATGTEVTLNSNIATNTPKLFLDSSLDVGTFNVELMARYENTPLSQVVVYNLTVTPSDPVAVIFGGTKKTIPSSQPYTIDGSKSYDPDSSATVLQYSWTCSHSYPLTPPTNYQNSCSGIIASTSSSVTMATTNILAAETYTITLTVTNGSRTSSTTTEIIISSNDVPVAEIDCVTLSSAKKGYKLNAGDHVALKGSCLNCLSTDTIYYEWSLYYDVNNVRTQLTLTSAMSTMGTNSNNYVLKSGNLPTASSYTFKLEISRTALSATTYTSSSELTIAANSAPSGGSCTKTKGTNIDPLDDTVQCSCTGYADPDNSNGELNYKVMSFSKDPASSTESVVIYYGVLSSPEFHVAPWPGTVRTAVKLQVSVVDEEGAETLALNMDISVSSTVTTANNFEFLQNHTITTLPEIVRDNNPTRLLQYGIAMTQEMNEISRQESTASYSHIDDRNNVRNRIALSVLGLPLETSYQRSQMAFILSALTEYEGEFQTHVYQTLLFNEIDGLKSEMEEEAFQGADQSELTLDLLVEAVTNTMDAVNAAVFNTVNISNVTSFESTALTTYKPEISVLNLTTSVSTETHKQNIVIRGFQSGDDIIILSLKTQLLGERISINQDNFQIIGMRIYSDAIEESFSSEGCVAFLHPDMLDAKYPTRTEVFQIMRVTKNQFTWGSDVNTKLIAAGFTDTSGTEISVTNIQSGKRPKFFILKDGAEAYENLTDSIVNSTSYDPNDGITFSSTIVSRSNKKKISIDTSAGYEGAALHVQILFSIVANPSTSATAPDTITAYLGKNYVASQTRYETKITLKTEHRGHQYDHRSYTLFRAPSDFDPDDSYSITVYNDDSNYDVNVTVGPYFSTCQFFDMSQRTWKTSGCTPTEESIERYACCECNHFTPFGGGLLAPPNIISFADLLDLDLSTNPVVFVACTLIFVVYIVSLIICRRLDQSNLERISSIPLCGKDGSFKYEVTVVTGRQPGSGTTANVGIRMYGEYGRSSSKQLDKKWAFQRNCQDTFIMAHDVNLGNIEKLMVWHDNSGLDPSWYLIQVIVKDLQTDCKYYFFGNFWMSLEMDKGFIQKELFAAGSSEIQKFGRMFSRAASNFMADRHLWYSVVDRPAQSRFTRVQRATCVVTILYSFMAINAMWYGLLKQQNDSGQGLSSFGWEEVVLSLVTNVMAFPFSLMIIWMFKRSKSKTNIFEHGNRLGTAQTIEIDYDPNLPGSFKTNDDLLSYYDRESTTDSLVQATMTQHNLKRSKTLKVTRQATDDSLNKAVNSYDSGISGMRDSTEGKLKRTNNPQLWSKGEVAHKDETYITKTENNDRKEEVKQVADGILQYLDDVESKCMAKEQSVSQRSNSVGGGKSSLRRTGTKKSEWKEVDDILHSDTETNTRSRPLQKKDSTSTIGSYGKPTSSQSGKGYNPREDPNINGHDHRKLPSAGSTFIWADKLRASGSMCSTTANQSTMPEVEGIGPLQPDMGLAARSDPDRDDMQLIERRDESKKCTLPAWFVYVAYVICFLLSVTSVILVIMYGQTFGADVALQWILALLFCIAMSFIVIEPLKALVIALYASSILKKEDTADEDVIDIQPTIDTSNEKVKESKFAPLAGFSLLNAKEEGQKIRRMRTMIRQFIAYIFYLWLLMTLSYVNFKYETYLFKSSIDNTILQTTIPNTEKSFINISDVDEFWSWSQSALVGGLHYSELNSDLEYGTLLGVARMRMVRSIKEACPAIEHPLHSGLETLTNRTCWGNYGFSEDESHYGEGWNLSQNLSWQYSSGSQTESKSRYGYVYTYGGGGYVHNLGTTYNDTLTILQNLQAKNWIDERTRAIFIDFTMYSIADDLTAVVNLMIEFPLTGGLNTSSEIQSQVLLRFVTDVVDPLMVCQCILFLVNIYLVCHIFNAIKDHRKEFFKDPWNWLEILTTLMAVVVNGLYIGCVVEATSTFNDFFDNIYGFTNFETISDTHIASRYVQAVLIFLLMIKVIKQLRFIKYLYIYERVLSDASGKLFGIAIIFFILFCTYGMVGYLFYGREVDGFESYWHTLTSIIGMQHGHFSFWALMDQQPIFTHFFLYFYYAFCYGITIALILSVLNDTFKTTKGQMYYKATMEMQDYEMIDFIMKRFKLWAGMDKPKQGSRRVHFDRRQFSASSRGSRPSSRDSNLSYDPFETNTRTTRIASDRLEMTWEDCLCTLERVCSLDAKEEDILKTTQKEIEEWKFQTRIKNYEREVQSLSDKPPKGAPSGTNSVRASKIPRRTSTTGSEAGNSKRGLGTPETRTSVMRGRPLSDQGGRAKSEPKRTNSRERFSIYNFFKSVNPSKDAWK